MIHPRATNGENQHDQQADKENEVANVQQRGPREHNYILRGAHQNIEGYLAVERIRVGEHADARHANMRANRNLTHGVKRDRACCAGMAHDGRQQVTVGIEYILILCGLPNLGNHLAFH
jgi:hypothetical protein